MSNSRAESRLCDGFEGVLIVIFASFKDNAFSPAEALSSSELL